MWMDSEYFMLSEISPAETGTNNITYMWHLRKLNQKKKNRVNGGDQGMGDAKGEGGFLF